MLVRRFIAGLLKLHKNRKMCNFVVSDILSIYIFNNIIM